MVDTPIKVGDEIQVNSTLPGNQTNSTVTFLTGGRFVVTWSDPGNGLDARARLFESNGTPVGDDFLVSNVSANAQIPNSIVALDNGGFAVVFAHNNIVSGQTGIGVSVAVFDANGARVAQVLANPGISAQLAAIVTLADGGLMVAYRSETTFDVHVQRFDSTYALVGTRILINTVTAGSQQNPELTRLSNGNVVVTFDDSSATGGDVDGTAVRAQIIAPDGSFVGGNFLVNTSTTSTQGNSAVTALSGGGFVVAWNDVSQSLGETSTGIKAQIYTNAGVPVGIEFRVNTTVAGIQATPSIAATADGGFVVTWTDSSGVYDATGNGIVGQRFDANGVAIGIEFLVNTVTSGNQTVSSISVRGDAVIVAWADTSTTGVDTNGGIKLQQLTLNVPPVGGADDATTLETRAIEISVLSNDSDADGPAPSIATVNGVALADGQSTLLTSGARVTNVGGVLQYNPNGAFNYLVSAETATATGAVDTSAVDTFSYTLTGSTSPISVSVTVTGVDGTGDRLLGNSGDNSVTGTPNADYFDLSQGGTDTINGGDGNDAFLMGAAFDATDVIDGGAGTYDQVGLSGNYAGGNALVLGSTTLRNVEVIGLLASAGNSYDITTHDDNVAAGQTLTVFGTNLASGSNFTFDGSNESNGSFRLYGGAGTDDLTGGAGNDGFWFGPGRFNPTLDRVDGGAGTGDQLALDGNYTITLDGTSIQGIEAITLQRGPVGNSNSFSLTLADNLVADDGTLTIWGYPLLTSLLVDGSAEVGGDLRIYGGAVEDHLIGGGGNDWLWGGYGGDRLEGGGGADVFAYDVASQSTGVDYDTLVGFDASVDRIDLPFAVTSMATAVSGTLSAGSFNQDLAAAIGAAQLGQGQAIMFTAAGGDMDGQIFVIVNGLSSNGYQAGTDYVLELVNSTPILTSDAFI